MSRSKPWVWIMDRLLGAWALFLLLMAFMGGIHDYTAHRSVYTNLSDGMKGFFLAILLRMGLAGCRNPGEVPVVRRAVQLFGRFCRCSNSKLYAVCLAYGGLLFLASALRHRMFGTAYDLSVNMNMLYNAAHGAGFASTLEPAASHLLNMHLNLLEYLLVPVCAVFRGPDVLFFAQVAAAILGAIPVYLLARDMCPERWQHILCVIIYLLYPRLRDTIAYDFHPDIMSLPLILFALYSFRRDRLFPFVACLLAGSLNKESLWLVTAFFGVFLVFQRRHPALRWRWTGVFLAVVGPTVFWLYRGVYMKSLPQGDFQIHFYAWMGGSLGEALSNMLKHPGRFAATILSAGRWRYVRQVFAPLGFLPMLAPSWLWMTIPTWGYILAREPFLFNVHEHHPIEMVPFLVTGFIAGYRRLLDWAGRWKNFSGVQWATFFVAAFSLGNVGSPETSVVHSYLYRRSELAGFHDFVDHIPETWSAAAGWDYYLPQIAQRRYVFKLRDVIHTPRAAHVVLINASVLEDLGQMETLFQQGYRVAFRSGPHIIFSVAHPQPVEKVVKELHWPRRSGP
jgi:uncharacterized membrane protein